MKLAAGAINFFPKIVFFRWRSRKSFGNCHISQQILSEFIKRQAEVHFKWKKNYWTNSIKWKDFKFINREEDMGIPGLRQAKMSYRPHHMVEVYHVNKEDIVFD